MRAKPDSFRALGAPQRDAHELRRRFELGSQPFSRAPAGEKLPPRDLSKKRSSPSPPATIPLHRRRRQPGYRQTAQTQRRQFDESDVALAEESLKTMSLSRWEPNSLKNVAV